MKKLLLMIGIASLLLLSGCRPVYVDGPADEVMDKMIELCGYQEGPDESSQKECLMNNLKVGDTIDDCWIDTPARLKDSNLRVMNCYSERVQYNETTVLKIQ